MDEAEDSLLSENEGRTRTRKHILVIARKIDKLLSHMRQTRQNKF